MTYAENMSRIGITPCPFCKWRSVEVTFQERKQLFREHLAEAHGGALSATVLAGDWR